MLKEKEEKVLNYVLTHGPCTPVDVSKAVGLDSFLSSAILASLAKNNYIKATKMKYGTSPLYYTDSQENKAHEILISTFSQLQKKVFDYIKEKRILLDENVTPQERLVFKELPDFVKFLEVNFNDKNFKIWTYFDVSEDEIKSFFEGKKKVEKVEKSNVERVEKPKVEKQKVEKPKVEKPKKKVSNEFFDYVLNKFNFDIIKENRKRSEDVLFVNLNNQLGNERSIIVIKEKITQNDLMKWYIESLKKSMRVYIITKSHLKNKFEEFVKVIEI